MSLKVIDSLPRERTLITNAISAADTSSYSLESIRMTPAHSFNAESQWRKKIISRAFLLSLRVLSAAALRAGACDWYLISHYAISLLNSLAAGEKLWSLLGLNYLQLLDLIINLRHGMEAWEKIKYLRSTVAVTYLEDVSLTDVYF